MLRRILYICLAWMLAGCQGGAFFHFGPTSTPFPTSFKGIVEFEGYKLVLFCEGSGEPTIILENGLGYASWPTYALKRFQSTSRTCTYLRAGMAGSPEGPRTTQDQVEDLHSLLKQTGVPGPYILVGHSIAGYNLILYTDRYPEEVVGLVCVDCRSPAFLQLYLDALQALRPENVLVDKVISDFNAFETDWKSNMEQLDLVTSAQQVMKVTSLGDRPFRVLVAGQPVIYGANEEITQTFNKTWQEANLQMSQLSSRSELEVVENVDHGTILMDKKVDEVILEVFQEVKGGK